MDIHTVGGRVDLSAQPPRGATGEGSRTPRARFCQVRSLTEQLAAPLSAEDQTVQSMPDVSPTKWHRAHTTWFFEEFVLGRFVAGYTPTDPRHRFLFNSYYEAVGQRQPRAERGLLSRPGVAEIARYRASVDARVVGLLEAEPPQQVREVLELGLHHEQQHQELALMDIKHVLSTNPFPSSYRPLRPAAPGASPALRWVEIAGGLVEIGAAGEGFAFDNERPRHAVHLGPFAIASRPVSCGEWLAFVADGGYQRPELWLSDGWATVQAQRWQAPLYWRRDDRDDWRAFTLGGERPVAHAEPVCHVSYYEADAYARWAGARLATEAEWEHAVLAGLGIGERFDLDALHPQSPPGDGVAAPPGEVWEWTASPYTAYPGFRPPRGALGEYNGKFMVNQHVLRGGSCVTPPGHARATYRNFFPPAARWLFAGVRLARDP